MFLRWQIMEATRAYRNLAEIIRRPLYRFSKPASSVTSERTLGPEKLSATGFSALPRVGFANGAGNLTSLTFWRQTWRKIDLEMPR